MEVWSPSQSTVVNLGKKQKWFYGFTGAKPSHYPQKLCNHKYTHMYLNMIKTPFYGDED